VEFVRLRVALNWLAVKTGAVLMIGAPKSKPPIYPFEISLHIRISQDM
jgi:hypothetical protein